MTPLQELLALLRPAAGGIHVVSTGREAQAQIQRRLYGVESNEEVLRQFRANLDAIARARAIVLGVPSDVGAGYLRGANMGPQAIRGFLLDSDPTFRERASAAGLVDIGDVLVVPQLLHDSMLSAEQVEASQRAMYSDLPDSVRASLPVSPLSMTERVLDLVLTLNPKVRVFVLGGDHSVAWPVVAAIGKTRPHDWGIVQIDAHTDLLSSRLGVKYCFATWSFHANDLLGSGGRLVQVGIRASGKPKSHWEETLGVKQFWADECLADPGRTIERIVAHVEETGVKAIYFSNDIDGTDRSVADATGTPEPNGLEPDFVVRLVRELGGRVQILASDVMEVAPPLASSPEGRTRTLAAATRYMRESLAAMGIILKPSA